MRRLSMNIKIKKTLVIQLIITSLLKYLASAISSNLDILFTSLTTETIIDYFKNSKTKLLNRSGNSKNG
jgi:hypothetical protein